MTVEDQTSALLCCAEAHALPPWSPNQIVKDTLKHYAERGDIQVLGGAKSVGGSCIFRRGLVYLQDPTRISYFV